jgi:hypothetical protein
MGFLGLFLGSVFQSIFPLFLDFARSVSCLFYCAFSPSRVDLRPLLDLFSTVHLPRMGFLSLRYSSSKEWPGLSCLVCLVAVFICGMGVVCSIGVVRYVQDAGFMACLGSIIHNGRGGLCTGCRIYGLQRGRLQSQAQ